MRCRFIPALPAVILALLMQVLAPVSAQRAMAAAFDPITNAPICINATGATHAPDQTPAMPHAACDACLVVAQGSLPAPDVMPITRVAFATHMALQPAFEIAAHAQNLRTHDRARAPPHSL